MNFLKKLFGGGGATPDAPKAETVAVLYKDFSITADPINEGGTYRVAALIEKGEQSHQLIRADTTRDPEEARQTALAKAKQMIDEQGDRIFS